MPPTDDRRFYLIEEPETLLALPPTLPDPTKLTEALRNFLRNEAELRVADGLVRLMIEAGGWVGVWDGVLVARLAIDVPALQIARGVNGLIHAKHLDVRDGGNRQYLLPSAKFAKLALNLPLPC
jgi:hypothetical protein